MIEFEKYKLLIRNLYITRLLNYITIIAEIMAKDESAGSSPIDSYENSNGYSIVLKNERVEILREQKEVGSVLLEDVLGVHQVTQDDGVKLVVHGFPKTKKIFRSEARSLMKLVVHFDSDNTAEEWKKKIIVQSRKVIQEKYDWYQGKEPSADPRKYLVLINPVGGKGKAVHIFRTQVQPLLNLAGAECQVVVTEYAGHAQSMMKTFDLSSVDALIIASGDGLLFEVVNGIMERPDWENAITTTIGILPVGSGNALCASLLYEAEEEFSVANATFQIICGAVAPMDVLTANTIEGTKYFCLLADWGIIADIDIESEKYRRIGEMRFFFGAISCIVRKKAYPGKLSYLPKDAKLQGTNTSKAATNDSQVLTEETSSPKEDGELVVTNGMESPTNETSDNCIESHHEISTTNNGVSEATADSTVGNEVNSGQTVPPTPFMNKLSEPVPSNWVEIDAEFMNIAVATISHLGHDIFNTKQAYVGCGTIYLVYAEANLTSRMDLFKLMDRMAKGNHTEMNIINVIEAKAFRIEPSEKSGILTLDGEMIPFGPMQAQIHPQLGRVLGRRLKRT